MIGRKLDYNRFFLFDWLGVPLRICNVCCVVQCLGHPSCSVEVSCVALFLYLCALRIPLSSAENFQNICSWFREKGFDRRDGFTVHFFAITQERRVSTGIVHALSSLRCVVWHCRIAIFIKKFTLKRTASLTGTFKTQQKTEK